MNKSLHREVVMRCPLDHAFDTFVARVDLWWPRSHRRFEDSTLTLEDRVGGRFYERSESGEEAVFGHVLQLHRPHSLTYTWNPGGLPHPTHVEISFETCDEGTRVTVLHSPGKNTAEDFQKRVQKFAQAWDHLTPFWVDAAEL